ncbi:toxin-antitoxin system, toxin component [Streptomyces similanensis]|uniref:Toxin-antitoxin system, toxin component n=1 Tax=Streptomyces similanensis TaxID=1274988 RepID=A0ABP9L3P3_9ACTN
MSGTEPSPRAIAKAQRKLMAELVKGVTKTVHVPAEPTVVFGAICQAMSRRRNDRPINLTIREFPEEMGTITGLWLDLKDQDVIVIEKRLAPDHQAVVLGHELWHMEAGHCGHDFGAATVAARAALSDHVDWPELARHVAARSHSHQADEVAAEGFGLLLGSRMTSLLATPGAPQLDDVARRISAALGYSGQQG